MQQRQLGSKMAEIEPDHVRVETNCRNTDDKKAHPRIKALSFFSGALGLDLGLEKAGVEVLLACENDKACRKTISANRPNLAIIGDIREYSATQIREYAGMSRNEKIDLIVGGPPCQAFSTAGARRGLNDERGNVFLKFLELIAELKPQYAVIENVRGLLSAPLQHHPHANRGSENPEMTATEAPGGVLMMILDFLRNNGYTVSFNLYNSANFGSPQIRERVVLMCYHGREKLPYLTPTHSKDGEFNLPAWRTFAEAVDGLGDEHHHVVFPEKRIKYYKMLAPGQCWKHLPSEEIKKEAMGRSYYSRGGKTGFLRRLAWDKPSPTLVTHPAMPATDLAHPELNRPLSIEEYKRIQEFPDDFEICGTLIEQYRQVGNAVPTSLGKAIGDAIVAHQDGKPTPCFDGFSYSRYKNTDDVSWEQTMRQRTASSISK